MASARRGHSSSSATAAAQSAGTAAAPTATLLLPIILLLSPPLVACYAGPGPGSWTIGKPDVHGLDASELSAAALRVAEAVPFRHCFLVVKDGEIMHELYAPGNSSETKFETDSVGKTMTAALMGTAVTQGKLDLDRPLREYGVKPRTGANWSVGGTDFFPNVTARHLLSQSSGYGRVAPGTFFTYDSVDYIEHLSDAVSVRSLHSMQSLGHPCHAYHTLCRSSSRTILTWSSMVSSIVSALQTSRLHVLCVCAADGDDG